MTEHDGNGQPAPKRYVIVDHLGSADEQVDDGIDGDLDMAIINARLDLPVGGRFTVTRTQ